MYSLSARFRKSTVAGEPGSVYYIIREISGGSRQERNISAGIRGYSESVISLSKSRIAFDLMTLYCVIEKMPGATIDAVAQAGREALTGPNPFAERIKACEGRYPVRKSVATVAKLFADSFEVVPESPSAGDSSGLLGYFARMCADYSAAGKSYAKSLRSTSLSLADFLSCEDLKDLPLAMVDAPLITSYTSYLRSRVTPATVSFYLRVLRNVLRQAEADGLLASGFRWPAEVKTTVAPAVAPPAASVLDLHAVNRIELLDLSATPALELARDMFLFSFYARGMELVDLANLRRSNLGNNLLSYRRRGKGQWQAVPLGAKALEIVAKYSGRAGDYLFPILQRKWLHSYASVREEFAAALKTIGERLSLPAKLTFSQSRHAWQALLRSADLAGLLIS